MGKTGSGKTTNLEANCGLKPVAHGKISINNTDVTHVKPDPRQIGFVQQQAALLSTMRIYDHRALALHMRHTKAEVRQLASM